MRHGTWLVQDGKRVAARVDRKTGKIEILTGKDAKESPLVKHKFIPKRLQKEAKEKVAAKPKAEGKGE